MIQYQNIVPDFELGGFLQRRVSLPKQLQVMGCFDERRTQGVEALQFCLYMDLKKLKTTLILCSVTHCRRYVRFCICSWVSNGQRYSHMTIPHIFSSKSFIFTALRFLMK
jgi:hypothetical protein